MNLRRAGSIFRKELRHIIRDRMTFFLVVVSPALVLVTMAGAFSIEIRDVSVAVLDRDRSEFSRRLQQQLETMGELQVSGGLVSEEEMERSILAGRNKAAIVIPPGFEDDLLSGAGSSVQVVVDGTDPSTAEHAITHIMARVQSFALDLAETSLDRSGMPRAALKPPIELRTRTWYNPSLIYKYGMVPALLAVALGMPAISVSLAIAREHEWGTLEMLIATPVGRLELLLGKLLPYLLNGLVSTLLCLGVSRFVFDVPFRGSLITFMLLSAAFFWATLSMGLLLSVLVRSQQVAMIGAFLLFLFPGFFLSGIFIPLSSMGIMKLEAYMIPTTHYVMIARGVFLKGSGLMELIPYAVALVVIGAAMAGLAVLSFQKRLR